MKTAKPLSIYVHLPFCASLCAYCSFPRLVYREEWAELYLRKIESDLDAFEPGSFLTAYVGGGTPSALPNGLLAPFLSKLRSLLKEGAEFSFEANPEDIDGEKAALLSSCGVNRVSMGMETSREEALAFLGRRADQKATAKAVECLRSAGIENVSLDLIYGLPGETLDEVRSDIEALLAVRPSHFSTYSLEINPGSRLSARGYEEAPDDVLSEQLDLIKEEGRKRGFRRYEVSSFALPGFECVHNKTYWKDEEYVGIGMGAAGYENGIRYRNSPFFVPFLEGKGREEEKVEGNSAIEYYLLTNLRLSDGFLASDFEAKFGVPFLKRFGKAADALAKAGLLETRKGRVAPTDRGLDLLDRILLELYNSL